MRISEAPATTRVGFTGVMTFPGICMSAVSALLTAGHRSCVIFQQTCCRTTRTHGKPGGHTSCLTTGSVYSWPMSRPRRLLHISVRMDITTSTMIPASAGAGRSVKLRPREIQESRAEYFLTMVFQEFLVWLEPFRCSQAGTFHRYEFALYGFFRKVGA